MTLATGSPAMKLGVLFSGGKDSTYAMYLAKQHGHDISCLISVLSANPESYMFHTPSIEQVRRQAEVLVLPLILQTTEGEKEEELADLEHAIVRAIDQYGIRGVVTGAVASVYQASRVQRICDALDLECLNPLWQKDQLELLEELLMNRFEVVITGVFAYPLTEAWLGRRIDHAFIAEVTELQKRYKINPAGEGGEFETLVLNCPLFQRPLGIRSKTVSGKGYAFSMEVELELE